MSTPNYPTQSQNDARYAKPADVAAAISTQATTDAGQYLKQWKQNTAYSANQYVLNPYGQVVFAIASFTSGATYVASNWNVVPSAGSGLGSVVAVSGVYPARSTVTSSLTTPVVWVGSNDPYPSGALAIDIWENTGGSL